MEIMVAKFRAKIYQRRDVYQTLDPVQISPQTLFAGLLVNSPLGRETGFEPATLPTQVGMRYLNAQKKSSTFVKDFILVGKTGFEPATPCTPYKCATGLRHFPNKRVANLN